MVVEILLVGKVHCHRLQLFVEARLLGEELQFDTLVRLDPELQPVARAVGLSAEVDGDLVLLFVEVFAGP